jgi:endonuclease YncB( thermonuclease family)
MKMMMLCALIVAWALPAHADPCEGKLPSKLGTVFTGTVRYVVDGDGFCVGSSSDPNTWIEVRMADFDAPELSTNEGKRGKDILAREIANREISCTTSKGRSGKTTTYDRVLAVCQVNGSRVADMLARAGALTGGN